MIAIAAYTEPVVSDPVSFIQDINDSRQIQETEEDEKQTGSFAEILAGLLNGNVTPADSSDTQISEELAIEEFGVFTGEMDDNGLNIEFSNIGLSENIEIDHGFNIDLNSKTEFDEILLARAFENSHSAGAAQTDFSISADDTADLQTELSAEELNLKNANASLTKKDAASNQKSSDILAAQSAEKTASGGSANQGIEEALAAEIAANKKRAAAENNQADTLSKTERKDSDIASIISSIRNAGKENAESSRSKEERFYEGGRLDELRKLSRRDRIAFEIRDQRTMVDASQNRSFMTAEAAVTRVTDASPNEMTLELRLPDFNNAGQASQTTWEAKSASALENMLARELHQNFNGDIVRHASMALRDGGESTIRLALRPESLGNVKIHLEMADNKITGVILVESEEALNAFRKELAALEQAFKESGFADANLNLSLSDGGNNEWQQEENPFASGVAAYGYEDSLRDSASFGIEAPIDIFGREVNGAGYVNMLA